MRVRSRSRLPMQNSNNLHRWTVSFADFMTLMFAVFVVLYAVSASKEDKYKEVMQSIQGATKLLNQSVFSSYHEGILSENSNSIVEDAGPAIHSEKMLKQADDQLSEVDTLKVGRQLNQLKTQLEALFLNELSDQSVKLDLNGDWLTVELGGQLLFAGGSHSLLNTAAERLRKLAKVLKPVNNMLRIRGYTDQDKISNEIYFSNWELSGIRAFTVLHALNKQGIAGPRMVVEAYGKYSPVSDKNGNIDNMKSRRVVIAISKYALVEPAPVKSLHSGSVINKKNSLPGSAEVKPDSQEMHELRLPNNRLIITTRQE